MDFEWTIEEGKLSFALSAPTTGWVLVGFNKERTLQGARLVFLRLRDGKAEGEIVGPTSAPTRLPTISREPPAAARTICRAFGLAAKGVGLGRAQLFP